MLVRASFRSYVSPQKSFLDFNEIWHVGRNPWVMHGDIQHDTIQDQGHKPLKVGNRAIFNSYLLRHLQWELATDHGFLNYGTISTFDEAGFVIFVLVFVSCDFELGRNVSCEESTVSPVQGYIFTVTHCQLGHFMLGLCKSADHQQHTMMSIPSSVVQPSAPVIQRLLDLKKGGDKSDRIWPVKAVTSLVKRLTKIGGLDELEKALNTQDSGTECITIPRFIFLPLASYMSVSLLPIKQGVVLSGCNTTGPPRAAPWWVTLHMRVLQMTTTGASNRN